MDLQKALESIKQHAFPGKAALERELSDVKAESQAMAAELESVRTGFETAHSRDTQQIAGLQQQLDTIESDRSVARQRVQELETSLTEAVHLQEQSRQQIETLQRKLEDEHSRHESSMALNRETLALLQADQQKLQSLQADQATAFHEIGSEFLMSMQAAADRSQPPVKHMTVMAGLLFITGTLVGAVTLQGIQDSSRELSEVRLGMSEVRSSIKQHISNQDALLLELTQALNRDTESTGVPETAPVPGGDKTGQENSEPESEDSELAMAKGSVQRMGRRPVDSKWGPSLLMKAPPVSDNLAFDPGVKAQQIDLMTLGFNLGGTFADGLKGAQTIQALEEFRLLYLPVTGLQEVPSDEQLSALIKKYADQAREDEKRFHVDSGVLAAIRLGSLRTGVEFSFLMELAAVESTFDPASKAASSTAAGLYQFKNDTWLDAVRIHGDKYGLGEYVSRIEYSVSSKGKRRPVIQDPQISRHVLDLRFNPRISALLAAQYVRKNMMRLLFTLDRIPARADLYLTHFLGASGAISFLKALDEDPDRIAGEIFPRAAKRNQKIFLTSTSKPRTVAEVYEVFTRKFNTSRYEDG